MAVSFLLRESIKTTKIKAKELSKFVEPLITKAKKDDIATVRYLARFFPKEIVWKLIKDIASQYKNRKGGYTRIIKLGQRKSDGAQMAIIELVK